MTPRDDGEGPPAAERLQGSMKYLSLMAAGVGSLLPGVSFFVDNAPPMFHATGLLATGVALAILFYGYFRKASWPLRRTAACIGGALILMVSYQICLEFMSVTSPPERDEQLSWQIGFGMAEWSWTSETREQVEALRDTGVEVNTPGDLMLVRRGWEEPTAVRGIWKSWTIVAAGTLLILEFVLGFVLWTYGFAVLARYVSDKSSTGEAADRIRVVRILPHPAGDQRQNEALTLENPSHDPVSLAGWRVRDASGKAWSLDELGTIGPGQQKCVKRLGQPMALKDAGGTIELVNAEGVVLQRATYRKAKEGESVSPRNES